MDAGRLGADDERRRDLAVGVATGDEGQDLHLARGQAEDLLQAPGSGGRSGVRRRLQVEPRALGEQPELLGQGLRADPGGDATKLGPAAFGTMIGPGFLDHFADFTADDLPTNIRGMRGLVGAFAATPLPPEDVQTLLCSAMTVPARIRANLGARQIDGDDVLRTLRVPLLVTQGREDTVVLPAMAEHVLATCPTAEASWYEGIGHTPHLEAPERFNRELADLTRRAYA
jgi:pimeloyl-ACP methyl ester carboxylesterase